MKGRHSSDVDVVVPAKRARYLAEIDLATLGAFEATDKGDIANWMVPGKMVKGPGGAMDLVAGVKRVVAVMEHCAKDGSPKILKQCTLPITGLGVVNLIITDLCVFEVKQGGGLVLTELHPGVTVDDIRAKTGTIRGALGVVNVEGDSRGPGRATELTLSGALRPLPHFPAGTTARALTR